MGPSKCWVFPSSSASWFPWENWRGRAGVQAHLGLGESAGVSGDRNGIEHAREIEWGTREMGQSWI